MKAVILAAGMGKRLRPITLKIPKPLIKIGKKPILQHNIESLEKSGISEIALVIGYKKERIIEFAEDYSKNRSLKFTFIEQKEQLGTGHALKLCKGFTGNDNFILLMGDDLYSENDVKNMAKKDRYACIAAAETKTPEKFGVLEVKNNFLIGIEEKPSKPKSNLINTGLYKFTPEIYEALKSIKKSARGEYELPDAISILAKKKKVRVYKIQDYWMPIGDIAAIRRVEKFFIEVMNRIVQKSKLTEKDVDEISKKIKKETFEDLDRLSPSHKA